MKLFTITGHRMDSGYSIYRQNGEDLNCSLIRVQMTISQSSDNLTKQAQLSLMHVQYPGDASYERSIFIILAGLCTK